MKPCCLLLLWCLPLAAGAQTYLPGAWDSAWVYRVRLSEEPDRVQGPVYLTISYQRKSCLIDGANGAAPPAVLAGRRVLLGMRYALSRRTDLSLALARVQQGTGRDGAAEPGARALYLGLHHAF